MLVDRYSLFIFDWDGTLSTSTSLVKLTRFLKRRYSVRHIKGNESYYSRIDTMPQLRRSEEASRVYAAAYGLYSLFFKPSLKPGAAELLSWLKARGKKVAIFSDSNRYRLLTEVRKLGVVGHVDFMLSADSIKRFKPNPTGIMMIMEKFRCGKSRCIYVGDMASDIFTARFAGVASCSVGDGIDPPELLRSVKPDYFAKDLKAVMGMK